ncbi:DUF3443 family protein [Paraburkholderia sp. J94]|uniref:DUF3443 family protein n=1 Tax=Paraburkholderia sp. J94 TaxID=2805441 RepID=UPI002AB30347|nr:DUF3443 family protein [Paraburkholderia sp. J94]
MTTLFSLAVLAGGVARLAKLFPADGASLKRVFRFAPRRAAAGLTACGLMLALAACGGGGSSSDDSSTTSSKTTSSTQSPVTASSTNTMTVTVEQGLSDFANQPFVTVTVCAPGSTTLCDTIDHVLLDTGSTGLRVLSSALSSTTLAGMPREQLASSGYYIDACGQFVSGYTWGAVRTGDVQLGSQTASSVPFEVIGDSAAGTAPTTCSGGGNNLGTVSQLGANGILGLQGQIRDCGTYCVTSTLSNYYFACASGSGCSTASTVPLSQQVTNPVSMLGSGYNNGIVLSMPTVSDSGQATASGTLYLGVGTQTNNTITSASQIPLDAQFEFQATYGGTANQYSFIDSGSNYLTFRDSTIARCTGIDYQDYYCPSSVQTQSVTFAPNSGASSSSGSYTGTFKVGNMIALLSNSNIFAFNDLAAYGLIETTAGQGGLDFGMPFFYGRYVVIKNESSSGAGDAYAAFASNGA